MDEGVIWDGSQHDFSQSQINSAKMFGNKYWLIAGLFIQNIQAYKGERRYVVHHIDGNHMNNHPSNLMLMIAGAHKSFHSRQIWSGYTVEDYMTRCRNISNGTLQGMADIPEERWNEIKFSISQGQINRPEEVKRAHYEAIRLGQESMSQEAKHIRCERISRSQQKRWSDLSIEEHDAICHQRSIFRGGAGIRAKEFMMGHLEPWTMEEMNEFANYAKPINILYKWLKEGMIEKVGQNEAGMILYKQLPHGSA